MVLGLCQIVTPTPRVVAPSQVNFFFESFFLEVLVFFRVIFMARVSPSWEDQSKNLTDESQSSPNVETSLLSKSNIEWLWE